MVDRVVGCFFYRVGRASIIHLEELDETYSVCFLYIPNQKRKKPVGSVYYYTETTGARQMEFSHPFTSFQNHAGDPLLEGWKHRDVENTNHEFFIDGGNRISNKSMRAHVTRSENDLEMEPINLRDSIVSSESDSRIFFQNWNTAFVYQRHSENRKSKSWTNLLSQKSVGTNIRYFGPYYSEYAELTSLVALPPLVLIATGSGCNFLLDFFTWMKARKVSPTEPVVAFFSTESLALFQFVTDLLCSVVIENFSFSAHLTRHDDTLEFDAADDSQNRTKAKASLGRLSLEEVIQEAPSNAEVYFSGSPMVQWKIELLCAAKKLRYHPGSRYSGTSTREAHCVAGKPKCKCTGFPFPFQY